jgi:hypothetical protein
VGTQNGIIKTLAGNNVSIQLMSPASGDASRISFISPTDFGFHSINVPSEWGRKKKTAEQKKKISDGMSFHSINVPSEWGLFDKVITGTIPIEFPFN